MKVIVDDNTPCLRDQATGQLVETRYSRATAPELAGFAGLGWSFDWAEELSKGREVYKLQLAADDVIRGLVSLSVDPVGGICEVFLVESAPSNLGTRGRYKGVGGHLFAIACQRSVESGLGGYVAFNAKTGLIEHYARSLGARQVGRSQRMVIDEQAARKLIAQYLRK